MHLIASNALFKKMIMIVRIILIMETISFEGKRNIRWACCWKK